MNKPSAGSGKPRALLLAAEPPYPAVGGGPIRCASLLEYLAQRFSVHLISFHQPETLEPAPAIPPRSVDKLDLIRLPYHASNHAAWLWRTARRLAKNRPPLVDRYSGFQSTIANLVAGQTYDVAILEHFWCAPYVDQVRPHARHVSLDLHNIESTWHYSMAATANPVAAAGFKRFGKACLSLEETWLPKFDSLLVTSCEDAAMIEHVAPRARIAVYPNALPEMPCPPRAEKPEIVFSANLQYPPNIGAVRFFGQRIWPGLRERWPDLKWRILGRRPECIHNLVSGDPRIVVTGPVEEAVPVLAESQVAVVPVRAGSGTRFKIVEAWAAATPVVSTTLGAQGLEGRHQEHFLIADDPGAFADAVSRLLASSTERTRIGAAGRSLYETRYTWPAAWQALDSILK